MNNPFKNVVLLFSYSGFINKITHYKYKQQRFFSFFKWYRKRDPFTIRNGPSQFPNGPFHNWIKISHYESKHCNNVLKSAFFAPKLLFYHYYCLLSVCLKPVHHCIGPKCFRQTRRRKSEKTLKTWNKEKSYCNCYHWMDN